MILVGETLHGDDRPEDLSLHDLGLLVYVGDDGGLVIRARSRDLLTACEYLGPGVLGPVDEAFHAFALASRDQGPDFDLGVGDVAHSDRLDRGHEPREQVVVDPRTGNHAARRGAVLARVGVAGELQGLDESFHVGVVEDDYRRLAAELEVGALDGLGAGGGDELAVAVSPVTDTRRTAG